MPVPLFKNGKLLFCKGSLASTCCAPPEDHILTISLELVGNVGVYNAVAFFFQGAKWGNNCTAAVPNGVNAGAWVSTFDLSQLTTVMSPSIDVLIYADCNQWDAGDTVGHIGITATYRGHTVTASLVPYPINPSEPGWIARCPPTSAASRTVRATFGIGVTIL